MHQRPGLPTISTDYKISAKTEPPWLVLQDQGARTIGAHAALCKGAGDRWLIQRVLRDTENMGYSEVCLMGGNEPAMESFIAPAKAQRAQRTVVEGPPRG